MKKICFLFLSICLMTNCFLIAHDQSDNSWLEDWISAIELSKDNNTHSKAIEKYTLAIKAVNPNQVVVLLDLMNERGSIYLKMLEFKKAVEDFTFVINHPQANLEQKIEALSKRSHAYLVEGKIKEFYENRDQLEQLQPFETLIEDNKDYAIFKHAARMQNAKNQELFVIMKLELKEIDSEKDVIFTPSGLTIVKKRK